MEQQALRVMVQLRYYDWPVLLGIRQVVATYIWESEAELESTFRYPFQPDPYLYELQGTLTGTWVERPTISYRPTVGDAFVNQLLTPIRPDTLFALMEGGIAADLLMTMTVDSINGYRNASATAGDPAPPDEEFYRVVRLLRTLQLKNAIQLQLQVEKRDVDLKLRFFTEQLPEDLQREVEEVMELLGLEPERDTFDIAYGISGTDLHTIRLKTRPMMKVLIELSSAVEVPYNQTHLTRPSRALPDEQRLPFRVHSGMARPWNAGVAIRYRGQWFWINDDDPASKNTLELVLIILTVSEESGDGRGPVLTIPAG
ncbi:MAG: hypothetical protein SYC29_09930 [Planctomycetota bacterium]|nr:hypothetical protein [Planctomycetota bacterium]